MKDGKGFDLFVLTMNKQAQNRELWGSFYYIILSFSNLAVIITEPQHAFPSFQFSIKQ
jgi:hypothetical protein